MKIIHMRSFAAAMALASAAIGSTAPAQDAVTVAPEHFSIAFENDDMRAILGRIGPGETTPVILSTRGLNIWLTDAELKIRVQGGPTIHDIQEADDTQWLSADWRLSIENLGDAEVRWMHLETVELEPEIVQDIPVTPTALPFRLLEPEQVEAGRLYPLVVFLHGYGERGTDNERQLLHGVPEILEYGAAHGQPMFVLAPQHAETPWHAANVLANESFNFPDRATVPLEQTLALIEQQIAEHPIDPNRVYATGLSMGAFGVWDMVLRAPDRFAAAVLVAGGAPQDAPFQTLGTSVWILHGADDQTVHPDHSARAYALANELGLDASYTLVEGVAHDAAAWHAMYSDDRVLTWLFAQTQE